jgi:hypothetical protein
VVDLLFEDEGEEDTPENPWQEDEESEEEV